MSSEIIKDYLPYKDQYGLVQNNNWGPDNKSAIGTGNGMRFTAEAVIAHYRASVYDSVVLGRFKRAIELLEREPGLLNRQPRYIVDQDSHDNYIAAISIANIVGSNLAHRIYDYGKKHWFNYNNVNPGKFTFRSWLGRKLEFRAHLKMAIGKEPNIIEKLYWCIVIFIAAGSKFDDRDEWVLSWFLIFTARYQHGIMGIVRRYWIKKFKHKVPGGIGKVLSRYYADKGHPSIKWLQGEYGE